MTRTCNFPTSKTKRCKQPMADGKPNCGRHRANVSADQLGKNPTVYQKAGELHVWAGDPDGLYCLIHGDPAYQALCQLTGEKIPYCLNKMIKYRDEDGELHRDDGPAIIYADGTQEWYQHGRKHREGGPSVIWPSGTQMWHQHGELYREDGPAVIWAGGTQVWVQHGRGPAAILLDGAQSWWQDGELHRRDGPAMIKPDGTQHWFWHGKQVTEQEHARLREQSQSV